MTTLSLAVREQTAIMFAITYYLLVLLCITMSAMY